MRHQTPAARHNPLEAQRLLDRRQLLEREIEEKEPACERNEMGFSIESGFRSVKLASEHAGQSLHAVAAAPSSARAPRMVAKASRASRTGSSGIALLLPLGMRTAVVALRNSTGN